MRFKIVPEPRSVAFLRDVQAALPLVPGTVEDCCSRIRDRTELGSRDEAREYLTFAQALGLAREEDRGFSRTREEVSDEVLADRFHENVFGAREVLEAIGEGSKTVDECFDHVRDLVPPWERERSSDWEGKWRERTRCLLEWGVVFGLVERTANGYRQPSP